MSDLYQLLAKVPATKKARDAAITKWAVERLTEIAQSGDTEGAHVDADQVLFEVLAALDFDEVVAAWEAVDKWYA